MEWIKRRCLCFENSWQESSRHKKFWMFLCVYTILFLITFLLAYSPFLLAGKSFIWIRDGRDMHYPALVYIGRYLRQLVLNLFQGRFAIPTFDISLAYGGDIICSLNLFGFGDPLNLLAVFTPTKYIEYLYNALYVFRLYLAGLTFCGFCLYRGKRARYSLIGAIIYTFSGYAIYNTINPFFINPMIQLPLLLTGVDCIIKKKKPYLFVLSVFYAALCGFYFLYMMSVLLGIYTLLAFFSNYSVNRLKEFLCMVGRIVKNYLFGIGLAAVIIFPVIFFFLSSSRAGQTTGRNLFSYGWSYYQSNILKMIAPEGSFDTLSLAAIVFFSLVLIFSAKGRKYIRLKIGFLVIMMMYLLPLGGYIMHGFSYPTQRWTFGFALLLSYYTVEMLPVLLHMNKRQYVICFVAMIVYSLCVFVSPKTWTVNHIIGVALAAITLSTMCIFSATESRMDERHGGRKLEVKRSTVRQWERIGSVICIILVIGNVSIYANYEFSEDKGNHLIWFTEYGEETKQLESTMEREAEPLLKKQDGRFDSSSFRRNRGVVWHVPTTWVWWNMLNSNISELWKKTENVKQIGMNFRIDGTDQRTFINTLLSTRYFIDHPSRIPYLPYGYSLLKTTNTGYRIYENQYALPWGYTYDNWISYETLDAMNGLEKEEAMLQSIAIEDAGLSVQEGSVQSDIKEIPFEITGMENVKWKDGVLRVEKANATMTLKFEMPPNAEGYLRMQRFDINQSDKAAFDVTVKCADISNFARITSAKYDWYFGQENFLLNLGYSEMERSECTITFPKQGVFKLEDIKIYSQQMEHYAEHVNALRAEPLENITFGTNKIKGTIDLSRDKILCMSIPYSKGWRANVDGEQTEILRGNYMFMAIPLSAGYHQIELNYCTPGLKVGVFVSAISFVILLGLLFKERKQKKIIEQSRKQVN